MVEYSKVNVKLTDTQLEKLKTAAKNKTGTTLKMSLKISDVIIYLTSYYWQKEQKRS